MYNARYPLPAIEKIGWWYTYAPMVENYYWNKVLRGLCQGWYNKITLTS